MRVLSFMTATLVMFFLMDGSLCAADPVKVNAFNFPRAESDMYFARFLQLTGGLGKSYFYRNPTQVDRQDVVRMNRDTLYGAMVFDLDASPATITLPDTGKRFLSMQIVNQDHHTPQTLYAPCKHTLKREEIGTRYVVTLFRVFMDPNNPEDVKAANAVQDAIKVEQANPGKLELPVWDTQTHQRTREALLTLESLGGVKENRFGMPNEVDTVSWLIATASGWGGNPLKDAVYIPFFPEKNDGKTAYSVTLKDVPVDAFWSITMYDSKGFMFENPQKAYSLNSVTAKPQPDGSFVIQFGGDPKSAVNFLAITPGWNYLMRLYRPRPEILNGTWHAPEPVILK
jgi:hypothetical protein